MVNSYINIAFPVLSTIGVYLLFPCENMGLNVFVLLLKFKKKVHNPPFQIVYILVG